MQRFAQWPCPCTLIPLLPVIVFFLLFYRSSGLRSNDENIRQLIRSQPDNNSSNKQMTRRELRFISLIMCVCVCVCFMKYKSWGVILLHSTQLNWWAHLVQHLWRSVCGFTLDKQRLKKTFTRKFRAVWLYESSSWKMYSELNKRNINEFIPSPFFLWKVIGDKSSDFLDCWSCKKKKISSSAVLHWFPGGVWGAI